MNNDRIFYQGNLNDFRDGVDPDGVGNNNTDLPLISQQVRNIAYQWGDNLNQDFSKFRGYNNWIFLKDYVLDKEVHFLILKKKIIIWENI